MGKPAKERMATMRKKRDGRALTVWLYPETARTFQKIKTLTGEPNDAIAGKAIRAFYESVFFKRVNELALAIRDHLKADKPKDELRGLYRELVTVLSLDYGTADGIKKALNQLEIPNYSGAIGTWKIDQARTLINL